MPDPVHYLKVVMNNCFLSFDCFCFSECNLTCLTLQKRDIIDIFLCKSFSAMESDILTAKL